MSTKTLSNGWQTDAAWSPIAEMSTKRQGHAAVALNDHQCLIMGGGCYVDDSWHLFSSVELYDTTTKTWTILPDMKEKRAAPAATVVGNVVYVIGGTDGARSFDSVEVLDLNQPPEELQWRVLKPPMTSTRAGCAAAVVGRKIYIMGGFNVNSRLSSVEIFDMEKQEWIIGPSMTTKRHGCAAVAIGTTIYAIGGGNKDMEYFDTVECLNVLSTGYDWKWTLLPRSMPSKKSYPAATVIGGCIVVVGGCSTLLIKDTAEMWDPKCQKWMSLPTMSTDRYAGAAVTLGTTVLVIGGQDITGKYFSSGEQLHFTKISFPGSSSTTASIWKGDALDDKELSRTTNASTTRMSTTTLSNGWQTDAAWSPIAEMSTERYEHAAVALNDHQCLVMGGCPKLDSSMYLSSVELYDKTTNQWTKLADMKEKRGYHAAAVVENVVYVIGGWNGEQSLASMEVLDLNQPPEQWNWRVLDQLMTSNRALCAAAVVGRKIYVIGGNDDDSNFSSVEIFDTETREWSEGPSMTTMRFGRAAVSIGTTIYAIGGIDNQHQVVDNVECFDVDVLVTGNHWKWALLPQSMPSKRFIAAATVIEDCIVAAGGCSTLKDDESLAPAELWDPKCQKWLSLPTMSTDRYAGAAVTLGTTVLVIGGRDRVGEVLFSGEQLHFTKISVPGSSSASTASPLTGDASADDEFDKKPPASKRPRTTNPSSKMPQFQTRTALDGAISNAKVTLERAKNSALQSLCTENLQACQSIQNQLDELERHREDIKDQLPTVEQLKEEVDSLSSTLHAAIHNDSAQMLIPQLLLKQGQLKKEEDEQRRNNMEKALNQSRQAVVKALDSLFPSAAVEISSHYLQNITQNWSKSSILGEGAFGEVYQGVDEVTCITVAVKRFHSTSGNVHRSNEMQKQHEAEIKVLSKLSHPNIVRLLAYTTNQSSDAEETVRGDFLCLIYEYAAGGSMQAILDDETTRKTYDWRLRLQSCLSLVSALRYLHAQGFNHRDVKPGNICFTDESLEQAVLIDFGIACSKYFDGDKIHSTMTSNPGTAAYMAPEYNDSKKFTVKSEIYSVGVVIGALLTGSSSMAWVLHTVRTSSNLLEKVDFLGGDWGTSVVSNELANLAIDCMSHDAKDRPSFDTIEKKLADLRLRTERPLTENEMTSMNQFKRAQSGRRQAGAQPGLSAECACGQTAGEGLHCKRGHFTCRACLEQHVLDRLGADTIACPHSSCTRYFLIGDLCGIVSNDVFVRHYDASTNDTSRMRGETQFKGNLLIFKAMATSQKLDAILKGVALSASGEAKCPHLCILWPLKTRRGIRLSLKKQFRLIFLCAHDRSPIKTFIHLQKPKAWVKKAIPVLKFTLFALRVLALTGGLPLPLPLSIAGENIDSQLNAVSEVMHEFLNENDMDDFDDWLNDLSNIKPLDEKRVMLQLGEKANNVEGEAYGAISEIACLQENLGWQREMELVNKSTNDVWAWVKKENVQKWKDS